MSHHVVRKDGPELVFDELGHLFTHEVGMLGSGTVAPSLDAFVLLLVGPRFGIGVHRNTFVPPQTKEGGSWIIDMVKLVG